MKKEKQQKPLNKIIQEERKIKKLEEKKRRERERFEKTNNLIFDKVQSDLNQIFGTSQEIDLYISYKQQIYYRLYRIDNKRENILIQRTYNGKTTDEYFLYKNNIEHPDFYSNYQRFLDDLERDRAEYRLIMLYKNSPIIQPTKNFFAGD
jgi:hypothetical protein